VANILLGTNIETDDEDFIGRVIGLVDIVEISPDRWSGGRDRHSRLQLDPAVSRALSPVGGRVPFLVHGVGLSIASHDGWSRDYVDLLDQAIDTLPVRWHSEHLSYSTVDGEPLGTMIEAPCTQEALDLVCARVKALQDRYGLPFLLENVARAFPDCDEDQYSWAGFINAVVKNTDCGILLDVYNLQCDEHNFALPVHRFLDEIDHDSVVEVHIAGGTLYKGFQLDIHSRRVSEDTLRLTKSIVESLPGVQAIIFEVVQEALDELGYDTICDELVRLRRELICD